MTWIPAEFIGFALGIHREVICVQKRNVLAVCSETPSVQFQYDAFQKRICDGENISMSHQT